MKHYNVNNQFKKFKKTALLQSTPSTTVEMGRTLYLCGDVTSELIAKLSAEIIEINCYDDENEAIYKDYIREPIEIYIDSFGGYVSPALGFIDLIRSSETPITTISLGSTMSAAFAIFIAGDLRLVHKHSVLMTHQLSAGTIGTCKAMNEEMESVNKMNDILNDFIVSRTKITLETLNDYADRKKDLFIYSEDIVKYGVAEAVIDEKDYSILFKDGVAIPIDSSMTEEEKESIIATIDRELDILSKLDEAKVIE